MDLIEVLWKQDVDLGFTLVESTTPTKKPSTSEKESADEIEKLKALEAINATNQKVRKTFLFLFPNYIFCTIKTLFIHFHKVTRLRGYVVVISISQSQGVMSNCLPRVLRRRLLSRALEGSVLASSDTI